MRWLAGIAALTLVMVSAGSALALESPVGKWNTVDDKSGKIRSEVQIYEQGGKLFGKIVSLTDPNDEQGKPRTCINCTGADHHQPVVGLIIIRDISASGDRFKDGTILDPETGKIYRAELWIEEGKLKVRGYLGPFYRTQTWLKVR